MGANKKYSGYKSFQYLESGVDYKSFELVSELGRVAPYRVPVTEEQEQRAQELQARLIIVSLHDHPKVNPEDLTQIHDYIRAGWWKPAPWKLSSANPCILILGRLSPQFRFPIPISITRV